MCAGNSDDTKSSNRNVEKYVSEVTRDTVNNQQPESVVSGGTVLVRQSANCFELSTLLVSYLIGHGYDAYVASGYAVREVCLNDQTRNVCPYIPVDAEEKPEEVEEKPNKYTAKPPRDLRSKFLLMMEQRELDAKEKERQEELEKERLRIQEFERPPPDDYYGWRIHSWVIVMPGKRDVAELFFIEPSTGLSSPPSSEPYLGIESIWNHTNYWVNVQTTSNGTCKDLNFDLKDVLCWEHLLVAEPWNWRQLKKGIDPPDDKDWALMEKHLDMPMSWVEYLKIPHYKYEQRYPGGQKVVEYKKAQHEKYAPYFHKDGLVEKVTTFLDYEYQKTDTEYEIFQNRGDYLYKVVRNHTTNTTTERYREGRDDGLKKQTTKLTESKRVMEFYHDIRYDGLKTLKLGAEKMEEHYLNRDDLLYNRYVEFENRGGVRTIRFDTHATVTKIVERFHRNPDLPADKDIAVYEYNLKENEINLKYHYNKGRITAATRRFVKPPITEQGDRLTFNPSMTSGYVVDSRQPDIPKVELFWLLEKSLNAEQESLKHVRDMEDEINTILHNLTKEIGEPKLLISIFDEERNSAAKEGMKEMERKRQEHSEREAQADTDFLSIYLPLYKGQILSYRNAANIKQVCLSDYKQLLLERANRIQTQFDKCTEAIQAKHKSYQDRTQTITREEEEEHVAEVTRLVFRLHALEARLNRHKELAPVRYHQLETLLQNDPRLQILHSHEVADEDLLRYPIFHNSKPSQNST